MAPPYFKEPVMKYLIKFRAKLARNKYTSWKVCKTDYSSFHRLINSPKYQARLINEIKGH